MTHHLFRRSLAVANLCLVCLTSACIKIEAVPIVFGSPAPASPPPGLVDARDVLPGALFDVRYAAADNFTGEPLDGYRAARVFLLPKTAAALKAAQADLAAQGLRLKIFDGYRPLRAERHMARWARAVGREDLLRDGVVPSGVTSGRTFGHACGNAVDLTLVDANGKELDMGTEFDDFSRASWTENAAGPALKNRRLLKAAMTRRGFTNFSREWWHYNFKSEPSAPRDDEIR